MLFLIFLLTLPYCIVSNVIVFKNRTSNFCLLTDEDVYTAVVSKSDPLKKLQIYQNKEVENWKDHDWKPANWSIHHFQPIFDHRWHNFTANSENENGLGWQGNMSHFSVCSSGPQWSIQIFSNKTFSKKITVSVNQTGVARKEPCSWNHYTLKLKENLILLIENKKTIKKYPIKFLPGRMGNWIPNATFWKIQHYNYYWSDAETKNNSATIIPVQSQENGNFCISLYYSLDEGSTLEIYLESNNSTLHNETIKGFNKENEEKSWHRKSISAKGSEKGFLNISRKFDDPTREKGFWAIDQIEYCYNVTELIPMNNTEAMCMKLTSSSKKACQEPYKFGKLCNTSCADLFPGNPTCRGFNISREGQQFKCASGYQKPSCEEEIPTTSVTIPSTTTNKSNNITDVTTIDPTTTLRETTSSKKEIGEEEERDEEDENIDSQYPKINTTLLGILCGIILVTIVGCLLWRNYNQRNFRRNSIEFRNNKDTQITMKNISDGNIKISELDHYIDHQFYKAKNDNDIFHKFARVQNNTDIEYMNESEKLSPCDPKIIYIDSFKEANKFILTPSPDNMSIYNFWNLVYKKRINMIVMLYNLYENDRNICTKYWLQELNQDLKCNEITITLISYLNEESYEKRLFHLKFGRKSLKVTHFRLKWNPSEEKPLFSSDIVDLLIAVDPLYCCPNSSILIHSSSNFERVGIFIGSVIALEMASEHKNIDFVTLTTKINRQKDIIDTEFQFVLIHLIVAEYWMRQNFLYRVADGNSLVEVQTNLIKSLLRYDSIVLKMRSYCQKNADIVYGYKNRKYIIYSAEEFYKTNNASDYRILNGFLPHCEVYENINCPNEPKIIRIKPTSLPYQLNFQYLQKILGSILDDDSYNAKQDLFIVCDGELRNCSLFLAALYTLEKYEDQNLIDAISAVRRLGRNTCLHFSDEEMEYLCMEFNNYKLYK